MRHIPLLSGLLLVACGSAPPPGYITRADLGDQWPLTVDEGVLECANYKVITFRTMDGRRFAVNGAAKGKGIPPIDPIWRKSGPSGQIKRLERIPEYERQAIFAESVECEDEGTRKADAKYDPSDVKRHLALQEKLTESCKAALKKRHKLTDEEHRAISTEGVMLAWPPLRPGRVNIGPLIDRGFKLCTS